MGMDRKTTDLEALWKTAPRGQRSHTRAWFIEHIGYDGDDCLPWPFSRKTSGYGQLLFNGTNIQAHRLMCLFTHGEPPSPAHQAAHTCGKGHEGCCNPNHLRWATPRENYADRITHGTDIRGEKQPNSKITSNDAIAIIALRGRLPQKEIARIFGISNSAVSSIQQGKSWAHIS